MDSVLEFSHSLLRKNINKEDVVIDMTVGNGVDTLYLVGISKYVYGFDIQKEACIKAKKLLTGHMNYEIINDSHYNFDTYISGEISGAIFNLGYLPGGSKQIHTDAHVVLKTLEKLIYSLKKSGICIIVFYPGHESGLEEAKILGNYLSNLNQKEFDVLKYEFINQINNPPFLIALKKRI